MSSSCSSSAASSSSFGYPDFKVDASLLENLHLPDDPIKSVRGVQLVGILDRVLSERIFNSPFWKERCFSLSLASLVDAVVAVVDAVGCCFGNFNTPTPFVCLLLKLLQLAPSIRVACELLFQPKHSYLRCLGALYLRLVSPGPLVYQLLEPFLVDFRRIRERGTDGVMSVTHVDSFIDSLLSHDSVCGVALPRLTKRHALENNHQLPLRVTPLEEHDLKEFGIQNLSRVTTASAQHHHHLHDPPFKKSRVI